VRQAFSCWFPIKIAEVYSRSAGLTMPPYGKDGGSTRRSYTPNLYGVTTFSSAAKNLRQISMVYYRHELQDIYLAVSSLNSQYAALINSGSAHIPQVQSLPSIFGNGRYRTFPQAIASR
jgi:hypothetical protein